jgi:hypothetical protein
MWVGAPSRFARLSVRALAGSPGARHGAGNTQSTRVPDAAKHWSYVPHTGSLAHEQDSADAQADGQDAQA